MTGTTPGVPAPVIRLTAVVVVIVPFSGRSVPLAAPIAAAGVMATTASTKPENTMSLRSGIPATPFSISVHARLACPQTARGPAFVGTEWRPEGRSGGAPPSSAEDDNRSIKLYASFFGLVRDFDLGPKPESAGRWRLAVGKQG